MLRGGGNGEGNTPKSPGPARKMWAEMDSRRGRAFGDIHGHSGTFRFVPSGIYVVNRYSVLRGLPDRVCSGCAFHDPLTRFSEEVMAELGDREARAVWRSQAGGSAHPGRAGTFGIFLIDVNLGDIVLEPS